MLDALMLSISLSLATSDSCPFPYPPINPGSVGPYSVIFGISSAAVRWLRPVSTEITLYGPTDPGLIGGYGKGQHVCLSPNQSLITLTATSVIEMLYHAV